MPERNSRLVYSTDRTIPKKDQTHRNVPRGNRPAKSGAIVRLDRKGRGGKAVTVIEGLQLPERESEKLLKRLKAGLGAGGTAKNGSLEIQGDHRDAVMDALTELGYKPKRSGGR